MPGTSAGRADDVHRQALLGALLGDVEARPVVEVHPQRERALARAWPARAGCCSFQRSQPARARCMTRWMPSTSRSRNLPCRVTSVTVRPDEGGHRRVVRLQDRDRRHVDPGHDASDRAAAEEVRERLDLRQLRHVEKGRTAAVRGKARRCHSSGATVPSSPHADGLGVTVLHPASALHRHRARPARPRTRRQRGRRGWRSSVARSLRPASRLPGRPCRRSQVRTALSVTTAQAPARGDRDLASRRLVQLVNADRVHRGLEGLRRVVGAVPGRRGTGPPDGHTSRRLYHNPNLATDVHALAGAGRERGLHVLGDPRAHAC